MSVPNRHATFVLQLFANEGPLLERQLQHTLDKLGPGAATRMERALEQLLRSGDVLTADSPVTYYVAPAQLRCIRSNPATFQLIGHPGAENVLKLYGEVSGPDSQGIRRFTLTRDVDDIKATLAKFGISVGGIDDESD